MSPILWRGDSLECLQHLDEAPIAVVTDPPYAFGGDGDEHAISATVAIVLRESAKILRRGGWMAIMCAASLRSEGYMTEAIRGCGLTPVRRGSWVKPQARTKVQPGGWRWASVSVLVFRKGKGEKLAKIDALDWIEAPPIMVGRRAQLPDTVADWMVAPFATLSGFILDPFAGSGAIISAAVRAGSDAVGFDKRAEELVPGVEAIEPPGVRCPMLPGMPCES